MVLLGGGAVSYERGTPVLVLVLEKRRQDDPQITFTQVKPSTLVLSGKYFTYFTVCNTGS